MRGKRPLFNQQFRRWLQTWSSTDDQLGHYLWSIMAYWLTDDKLVIHWWSNMDDHVGYWQGTVFLKHWNSISPNITSLQLCIFILFSTVCFQMYSQYADHHLYSIRPNISSLHPEMTSAGCCWFINAIIAQFYNFVQVAINGKFNQKTIKVAQNY